MLETTLIVMALTIVAVLIVIARQPSSYRISRTATIPAPTASVFAAINELRSWEAWSPWAELDPQMKRTYEGPPAGVGAVYHWSGNRKVGQGNMTIIESVPNGRVRIRLEFIKPFASTCVSELELEAEGDETCLTWSMSGHNNFLAKAMHFVMNMDKMVGTQFEQGLDNLKQILLSRTAS